MPVGRTREAVCDALLALLRRGHDLDPDRAVRDLTAEGWEDLLEEATRQHVVGLARGRLEEEGLGGLVPAEVRGHLAERARRGAIRSLRLHGELAALLDCLADEDVPVVLLKGAHLTTQVYGNPALREMGDLDLLVPEARLDDAASSVMRLGYAPRHPFRVDVASAALHHLPPLARRRVAVEVHWHLVPNATGSSIPIGEIWERTVPVSLLGRRARALCTEDLLLHLCLHTSYQHLFGFGVRSLCDIRAVLDAPGHRVDWGALRARARAWRCERGVFLSLRLARDLLHARVPEREVEALRPDPFDADVLAAARSQLFADPRDLRALGNSLAPFAGAGSLRRHWRHVRATLFLDRPRLAALYGRAAEMSRLEQGFWYLVRAATLAVRRGRSVAHVMNPKSDWHEISLRQNRLRDFLSGRHPVNPAGTP